MTRTDPRRRRLVQLGKAAEHADYSTKTLRRWIAAGDLTGYRKPGGRHILVDLDELEELLRPIPSGGPGAAA